MRHNRLLSLAVGFVFYMLFLVACGAPQLPPSPVPLTPTLTSVLPTPTPTAVPPTMTTTPVSPMSNLTPLPPTPNPDGSGGGQIAFTSNRDGNWEIYVMNTDGSGQTNVTDHKSNDNWPTLSPDGTKIAFISDRGGNWEIYLVDVNGNGFDQLTDTVGLEMYPAWSPDGTQIAYMMGYDIFVMNADGSGLMMRDSGLPPSERSPGSFGIYIFEDGQICIGSGGSMETIEDNGSALGEFPVWSPDGSLVAFHSSRDGNMEIYVMKANGSLVTRLTDNEADDMFPAWSSDGTKIAFHSNRDGNLEVYMMNVDGSSIRNLTNNPAEDTFPVWHP